MIQRAFNLSAPVTPEKLNGLSLDLDRLFLNAVQSVIVSYVGSGVSGKVIRLGFKPVIVFIVLAKNKIEVEGSNNTGRFGVFMANNPGVTLDLPSNVWINNGVITLGAGDITLGAGVFNTQGLNYLMFGVG